MSGIHQTDALGLVALTEQRITAALDSLGLDEPEGAALELAKALSSVRALKGEIESEPGVPGSPLTEDRLKLATTAQMKFMRAICAHDMLPMLFDNWLGELRQLTSSCEVDGPEVDGATETGGAHG